MYIFHTTVIYITNWLKIIYFFFVFDYSWVLDIRLGSRDIFNIGVVFVIIYVRCHDIKST